MKSSTMLTEEQQKRIEENKQKALERRAARLQATPASCNTNIIQNISSTAVPCLPRFNQAAITEEKSPVNNFYSSTNKEKTFGVSTHSSTSNNAYISSRCNLNGYCTLLSSTHFCVNVGYHSQLIDIFRTIPSKSYDAKEKRWCFSVKDHDGLIKAAKSLEPSVVISPLPKNVVKVFSKTKKSKISEIDLSDLDCKLLDTLMPFQKEGVRFGLYHNGRVLIADDMGLGKTIQAIAIAWYYKTEWPLLVVTPSSVRYSWAEALSMWLPSFTKEDMSILNTGKDPMFDSKVVITSYDLLSRRAKELFQKNFKVVIMDESHFLKNHKSVRTRAAKPIMKKCKRLILLTGTPALSRPIELFTQISAVNSKVFSTYHDFGLRYCNARQMPWGWDYSGASNMTELQLLLEETVMIRRLKADVISQLPPKTRQVILLDPHSIHARQKVFDSMSTQICNKNLHATERRGVLLQYFKETSLAKVSAAGDYIKDLLESGKKFVCFAHHQIMLDGICEAVEAKKCKYIRIDGSTKSETRKQCCDIFQFNDECRVAVLSITAANAGISLTSAHLVVFAELFWNPGILTQAEDRVHRIGQEDSVVIQYLVAQGTADDHIWPLVQKKLNTLNKVGLSKDNFSDTATKKARDPLQPSIYEFLEDTNDDEAFWTQMLEEETQDKEPVSKKSRKQIKKVL